MISKSSLQNALSSSGIVELTETQMRILNEGKSPFNVLIHGRPNDGQTLGSLILMLNSIDINKNTTQVIFVAATCDAAIRTFETARKLSEEMGIRCGLVKFNEQAEGGTTFHCIFGTSASVSKCIVDGFGIRMVIFDDAHKSMSYTTNNCLLKHGAKYVCISSFMNKSLLSVSVNELQAMQSLRSTSSILSPNLRHVKFFCESQHEKLAVLVELCKWSNAKQIIIFVLVSEILFQNLIYILWEFEFKI